MKSMLRPVPAKTQSIVLVCGKCSKKVGGGFGKNGKKSLAKELRELGNGMKGRKSNLLVIETGCMKLCPKGEVVAINAAQPGEWLLVSPHTDMDSVALRLGILHGSGIVT
jgi:predicted metal-binding protein